ncbi:MAG: ATP-binding cassette domain-containing protein [Brockia lithotrophica]|nr:ATP-binding cassette domain-containing protein [Brockia lithotrophica]
MWGQPDLLVLRDVVFSYTTDGSPPLFEGLNFEIAQGEKVLLVGPNGSGKTTLLNLLAGLLESYNPRYQAFWLGKPVRLQEIRPEIAYVPAEDYLFDELTALEHIEVFRGLWTVQPTYREDVLALLRRLRLEELQKPVERFSLGMRRKLFLSLILARRSSLYLLDEPFNALDRESTAELVSHIEGCPGACVLVAHRPPEELRMDRVVDIRTLVRSDATSAREQA